MLLLRERILLKLSVEDFFSEEVGGSVRNCLCTASAWCMMHFKRCIRCLRVGMEEAENCDVVKDDRFLERISSLSLLVSVPLAREELERLLFGEPSPRLPLQNFIVDICKYH